MDRAWAWRARARWRAGGGRAALAVPGRYRTGFVSYPGYLTAACHVSGGRAWLQVTADPRSGDSRPVLPVRLGPDWGLHVVDVSIALGDLVALVRTQS